jgi:hypothetical protein
MTHRIGSFLVLSLLAVAGLESAAQEATKDPISRYAMDLRVRNSTQVDFDKDTAKFGVEVYTDGYTNDAIYISDYGALGSIPSKSFKSGDGKEPLWRHGLTLTVRKAGDKEWDKGKKFGIEVFRDENNGNLIYVNEKGQLATAAADAVSDSTEKGKIKAPTWTHAMDVRVRKAGEKDFTKETKKIGIEVFRDENNGNLVYISETGSIALVPSKLLGTEKGKEPKWQHGMELSVRKIGESKFGKDTKKFGIEVFQDEVNGTLVYVTETGSIATVPGKQAKTTPDGKGKDPAFLHGMDLAVRRANEKAFTKDTKKVGVEVYKDENNGNTIFISDAGELTVVGG